MDGGHRGGLEHRKYSKLTEHRTKIQQNTVLIPESRQKNHFLIIKKIKSQLCKHDSPAR